MLSREQAREIAEVAVIEHRLGFEIDRVVSLEEVSGRPPCHYLAAGSLDRSWIAYVKPGLPLRLRSSDVVVIDKESGEIIYAGSAGDEG